MRPRLFVLLHSHICWSSPVATSSARERPPWQGAGSASERCQGWPSWGRGRLPCPWWKPVCPTAPARGGTSLLRPSGRPRTASLSSASCTRAGTAYCRRARRRMSTFAKEKHTWDGEERRRRGRGSGTEEGSKQWTEIKQLVTIKLSAIACWLIKSSLKQTSVVLKLSQKGWITWAFHLRLASS